MSENEGEKPEDRGFRRLSSDDIWTGRGHASNGHSSHEAPDAESLASSCATCMGTGWLAAAPIEPGRAPQVIPCVCQRRESDESSRLTTYANLGNHSDKTFKTLKPRWRRGSADPDSLERAARLAKEFAKDPSGWLVISGPLRTGKSHLAAAITNHCTNRGTPTKFASAMHIAEIARKLDQWSEAEDAEPTWEALLNAPILVIDDFGMQLSNVRVSERLDQLLTKRAADPLPTVIVLAKSPEALPERFAQRLFDDNLCVRAEILPRRNTHTPSGQIPKEMVERMTFETFNANGAPDALSNDKDSLSVALASAKSFPNLPTKWIHFHGPTGVGKTHLAVAIAGQAQSNGITPTYWRVPELLDRLRDSYSDRSWESLDEILGSVKNSELLVLDDFIPATMSDWTLDKLYQLVCHRYDLLLPTVTAGQFVFWDPQNIERFSRLRDHYERQDADYREVQGKLLWESIMSRMQDRNVVLERLMSAPDYRRHYRSPWKVT